MKGQPVVRSRRKGQNEQSLSISRLPQTHADKGPLATGWDEGVLQMSLGEKSTLAISR